MLFNDDRFADALQVMKRVMSHPITQMFHERIPPGDEEDDYSPAKAIGFVDVVRSLRNHEYQTMQEWLQDVETVCHNMEECYSEDSFQAVSAREVRRRFNKEREKMRHLSRACWACAMQRQRIRFAKLTIAPPPKLKSTMVQQMSVNELPKKRQLKYTDHEIQSFLLAMEELDTKEEFDGLNEIIQKEQPGALHVPALLSFTFGQLGDSTLDRVHDYVKACLERKGRHMMA